MNGVIIIDKPAGWTSHDVVNRMRRILGQRSVGHLGTLDPLATGVLPLVTGSLTRLAQFYTTSEKSYEGVIRFGFATNTYDADGEPSASPHPVTLSLEPHPETRRRISRPDRASPATVLRQENPRRPRLQAGKKTKRGSPASQCKVEIKEFAILSVEGDRAHVPRPRRLRNLHALRSPRNGPAPGLRSPSRISAPHRRSRIRYHPGPHPRRNRAAYIYKTYTCKRRAGAPRGAGKRATFRRRDCSANKACHSEAAQAAEEPAVSSHEGIAAFFIHPRQLLPQFPSVTADEATAARIRTGRPVNLPELSRARQVKVFHGQSELIAIATRVAGTLFHPKIVFPPDPPARHPERSEGPMQPAAAVCAAAGRLGVRTVDAMSDNRYYVK